MKKLVNFIKLKIEKQELLEENTNWIIKEKVEYNNGLTVLMKVDS